MPRQPHIPRPSFRHQQIRMLERPKGSPIPIARLKRSDAPVLWLERFSPYRGDSSRVHISVEKTIQRDRDVEMLELHNDADSRSSVISPPRGEKSLA
ncbi:hypothetical protein QCA50_011004 [Cerrena zonata]|uniref:Uncharacterized protein n=1 Tax=Cerrena zonata TaxID=2478898 RepID=A0AAW0G9F5_9APHY